MARPEPSREGNRDDAVRCQPGTGETVEIDGVQQPDLDDGRRGYVHDDQIELLIGGPQELLGVVDVKGPVADVVELVDLRQVATASLDHGLIQLHCRHVLRDPGDGPHRCHRSAPHDQGLFGVDDRRRQAREHLVEGAETIGAVVHASVQVETNLSLGVLEVIDFLIEGIRAREEPRMVHPLDGGVAVAKASRVGRRLEERVDADQNRRGPPDDRPHPQESDEQRQPRLIDNGRGPPAPPHEKQRHRSADGPGELVSVVTHERVAMIRREVDEPGKQHAVERRQRERGQE